MYLRRQLPTKVLQVTGQLTLHHAQPTISQLRQHSMQQHSMKQQLVGQDSAWQHSKRNESWNQKKIPYQAQPTQPPPSKQQECVEYQQQSKQKLKKNVQEKQQIKKEEEQQGNREERKGKELKQRREEQRNKQKSREKSYRQAILTPSALHLLKEIRSRLQKMEQGWETNIGALNFQNIYSLREIRKQTNSLLQQMSQQMQSLRQYNQQWRQELQKEKNLLEKERQEWRTEKEQLIKEMEGMMEALLEEERKQAEQTMEEKFSQMSKIIERGIETTQVSLKQEVGNIQERLNQRVKQEVRRQQQVGRQLEVMSDKFHDLADKVGVFESSQVQTVVQKEKTKNEKIVQLKKIFDRTTPYAQNFKLQHNTISLQKEVPQQKQQTLRFGKLQMGMLDIVVGEDLFCFLVRINKTMKGDMGIGVTDRLTQKSLQCPHPAHGTVYGGIVGRIYSGTASQDNKDEYKTQLTNDELCDGMEVEVKVDKKKCTVTFTVKAPFMKKNGLLIPQAKNREYTMYSPILSQPNRQFVPCFVMQRQGQSINFQIQ